MCGIVGYYSSDSLNESDHQRNILRMREKLRHRGPDDSGIWIDAKNRVALGHRRLSIVDLSRAGHQPMMSKSERYVIVFNGEIYNHLEIRNKIDSFKSVRWKGHSDTETLIEAIDAFGFEQALKLTVGMFAFGIFDRKKKIFLIARDRYGEKPLYYSKNKSLFVFGSEIKSLVDHPKLDTEIDQNSIKLYKSLGFIPGPYTIYESINKVPPGFYASFNCLTGELERTSYWRASSQKYSSNVLSNVDSPKNHLNNLIRQSVRDKMTMDVPYGAFLSGGIDSSLIVATMSSLENKSIKTFNIGFEDSDYDESKQAAAFSKKLMTDHYYCYMTNYEIEDAVIKMTNHFDEPFADSSFLPTFMVSFLARKQVKVVLTGDGGDEIFGGYRRYYNRKMELVYKLSNILPEYVKKSQLFDIKVNRRWSSILTLLKSRNYKEFYLNLISNNTSDSITDTLMLNWLNDCTKEERSNCTSLINKFDKEIYLPDDILVKVDRSTMYHSLEARAPLLDHRITDFLKVHPQLIYKRGFPKKYILRNILKEYLPEEQLSKTKKGFSIPLIKWLNKPLKNYINHIVNQDSKYHRDLFYGDLLTEKWKKCLDGFGEPLDYLEVWKLAILKNWFLNNEK